MSKKKSRKSAASALPADMFTFSQASTFGLDGFGFDDPDNEGVEQKARLPEAKGMGRLPGEVLQNELSSSEVPVGIERSADELPDLTSMLEPSIVDLRWLSPPLGTPPERLPHRPVSIPELEEAWSARRTDGIHLCQDNTDLSFAQYHDSLEKSHTPPADTAQEKLQLVQLVRKAMRKEASGAPLDRVVNLVKWAAGEGHPALRMLREDAGLVGHVYIRADAYPGCANGRWSKHVRKTASDARFLIAAKKCNGCIRQEEGRCSVFRKMVVQNVPWRKAARLYAPKFLAVGHRLDMSNPREGLRVAFQKEHKRPFSPTAFPTAENPADTVTRRQADSWLDRRRKSPRKVVDVSYREGDRVKAAALKQLSQWRRQEQLSEGEFKRLASYKGHPRDAVRAGANLIARRDRTASYEGQGEGVYGKPLSDRQIDRAIQKAAAHRVARQRDIDRQHREKAVSHVQDAVARGLISKQAAKGILTNGRTSKEVIDLTTYAIVQGQHSEHRKAASVKARASEYVGAGKGAIPSLDGISVNEARRAVKTAHIRKVSKREVDAMVGHVRRKMNEGSAGGELDCIIRTMYSQPLIKAASDRLSVLRDRHEGLAGHLYVEARAYATPKGVKGCEEGALRHRGNGIKYVLAMKKCGSCVHRNVEGFCRKYAKKLTASVPHEDPEGFQLEMIRQANASDAEVTASLFAPSGASAIEAFGLQSNSPLEGFDFFASDQGDQPAEKLGEILWGGFEFVDGE